MAGTTNSITTKNKLVGKLQSDNELHGIVNTAYNPAYALVTEAGNKIVLYINSSDYKMHAELLNKNNEVINVSNIIDLPLETMVVDGRYNSETKEVILVLDNGNEISFSVADLVEGLVSTEDLENYVQFTDYASAAKAGVIKTSDAYATATADGVLTSQSKTYVQYENLNNNAFIGKGTLENVITGKQLVNKTYVDEADSIFEEDLFGDYKVTGEGESVTLNNTAECPMEVSLKPSELYQETTIGKNLFSDVISDYTVDNYRLRNLGTGSDTLTISFIDRDTSIDMTGVNIGFSITSNPNASGYVWSLSNGVVTQNTTNITTNGQQIGEKAPYIIIYPTDATTFNKIIQRYYIQVEKGTTATDYEPFTGNQPSPNPDYPQEIHSISGDNSIKIFKENLFDGILEQGSFNVNGGYVVSDTRRVRSTNYINVTNNEYIFSVENNSNYQIVVYVYDSNNNYIKNESDYDWVNLPFTKSFAGNRKIKFAIRYPNNDDIVTTDVKNIEVINLSFLKNFPITLPVENLFDVSQITGAKLNNGNNFNNFSINNNEMTLIASRYNDGWIYLYNSLTYYKADKYTISFDIKNNLTSGMNTIDCTLKSEGGSLLTSQSKTLTSYQAYERISFTFSISNAGNYSLCIVGQGNASTPSMNISFKNIQIEKGTKANTYTPYGTTPIEYCKIGDYKDEFFKNTTDSEYYDENLEEDKWYLKKNIGKVVLTGSNDENWALAGNKEITQPYQLPFNNNFITSAVYAFSNYFKYQSGDVELFTFAQNTNILYIAINKTTASTVQELKTWLSTHNVELYYPITPTYILLNNTLQTQLENIYNYVKSYQGQTNISQVNNDLPFTIKVSAFKNTTKGNISALISENKNQEYISNKVIEINSNSTDTQYPSAKCVYDLVGNIETLLEELDSGSGV